MTRVVDAAGTRTMLISIHPSHVQSILAGHKTVELRRRRPSVLPGEQVLIYATTPVAAVTARCRISSVESLSPSALWERYSGDVGISLDSFEDYFRGATSGTALHLCDVESLARPVTLAELRRSGPFQPPQTWHFLDQARVRSLLNAPDHQTTRRDALVALPWGGSLLRSLVSQTEIAIRRMAAANRAGHDE